MICRLCGGQVLWVGPLTNLHSTKCQSCGETNCQEVPSELDEDEQLPETVSDKQ